jgi:hypothetical protein
MDQLVGCNLSPDSAIFYPTRHGGHSALQQHQGVPGEETYKYSFPCISETAFEGVPRNHNANKEARGRSLLLPVQAQLRSACILVVHLKPSREDGLIVHM